jgi:hypothetical protein
LRLVNWAWLNATELSKKLGVSQPSVYISVNRGELIVKVEQLKFVKDIWRSWFSSAKKFMQSPQIQDIRKNINRFPDSR